MVDAYEISVFNPDYERVAYDLLKENNPNDVRGASDWTAGLSGVQLRFLPYNGQLSQQQLLWLDEELESATLHEVQKKLCHLFVVVLSAVLLFGR